MKKTHIRINAFSDVCVWTIIYIPLVTITIVALVYSVIYWPFDTYYLSGVAMQLTTFYVGILFPYQFIYFFKRCEHKLGSDTIFFEHGLCRKVHNIDTMWNSDVHISEVKSVEIVELTKEEMATKVYIKHWFNKYLRIDLKYGKTKYIYIGCYSKSQVEKIIKLLTSKTYRITIN